MLSGAGAGLLFKAALSVAISGRAGFDRRFSRDLLRRRLPRTGRTLGAADRRDVPDRQVADPGDGSHFLARHHGGETVPLRARWKNPVTRPAHSAGAVLSPCVCEASGTVHTWTRSGAAVRR